MKILSEIVAAANGTTDSDSVGDGALDVPQIRLTRIGEIVEKYLLSSENIPNVEIDDHVIRDRKDYETRKKYIYENPIKWYYDKVYEDE